MNLTLLLSFIAILIVLSFYKSRTLRAIVFSPIVNIVWLFGRFIGYDPYEDFDPSQAPISPHCLTVDPVEYGWQESRYDTVYPYTPKESIHDYYRCEGYHLHVPEENQYAYYKHETYDDGDTQMFQLVSLFDGTRPVWAIRATELGGTGPLVIIAVRTLDKTALKTAQKQIEYYLRSETGDFNRLH